VVWAGAGVFLPAGSQVSLRKLSGNSQGRDSARSQDSLRILSGCFQDSLRFGFSNICSEIDPFSNICSDPNFPLSLSHTRPNSQIT